MGEMADKIIQTIDYALDKRLPKLNRDITYICNVTNLGFDNNGNRTGICTVTYRGVDYIVENKYAELEVMDTVHLIIPNNNDNKKYLLEEVIAKGSIEKCNELLDNYRKEHILTYGDKVTVNIGTSGFLTDSNSRVMFNIPISKEIDSALYGSAQINLITINNGKLSIRQNQNDDKTSYLYGTSSALASISGLTISNCMISDSGITIALKKSSAFANTASTTNNNPVGIRFEAEIVFSNAE